MTSDGPTQGLLRRVTADDRAVVRLRVDGQEVLARAGDTLLVALLTICDRLRLNEFDGSPRAGFCMMGACQDCWLTTDGGERLRACSTTVAEGMSVRTGGGTWPVR